MPDDGALTAYDRFLTMVAWWNLYGLPVLLAAVVVAVVVLARRRGPSAQLDALADGALAVRRIGLIHYGLTVRAGIFLVQELLTLRVMGIPESPVILIPAAIGVIINPLLGFVLRRRHLGAWTRRLAIAWYMFLSAISVATIYWVWRYQASVDPARWPDDLIWLGLPLFLLVVMFVPRVRRAFGNAAPVEIKPDTSSEPAESAAKSVWPVVSLMALLFLIVLSSTVVVEAVDWACRNAMESAELP
jgi:hypothetical protein